MLFPDDRVLFVVNKDKIESYDIMKLMQNFQSVLSLNSLDCKKALEKFKDVKVVAIDASLNAVAIVKIARTLNPSIEFILLTERVFLTNESSDSIDIKKIFEAGFSDIVMEPNYGRIFISILRILRIQTEICEHLSKHRQNEILINAVDGHNLISKTNLYGVITYVNKTFCEISGYDEKELLGSSHNIVRHPESSKEFYEKMWATILSGNSWTGSVVNKSKNGKDYNLNLLIMPIFNSDGELEGFSSSGQTISQRQKSMDATDNFTTILRKNFIALKGEMVQKNKKHEIEIKTAVEAAILKTLKSNEEANNNLKQIIEGQSQKIKMLDYNMSYRDEKLKQIEVRLDAVNNLLIQKERETEKRIKDAHHKVRDAISTVEKYKRENEQLNLDLIKYRDRNSELRMEITALNKLRQIK